MFSRFFIDRPIFASSVSIVITLAGFISLTQLPLAQYPTIAPPTVQVSCRYPGASAQVVSEAVASPIEQQVSGVENMLYMCSQCASDGSYGLTVTFKQGVDLDVARVLVQNRVNLALPSLPDVIRQTGVTTRKRSVDFLMSISINSPRETFDQVYLSNYVLLHMRDELARLPGVGDLFISGQRDYSMRIWLDPEQLAARNLTAGDVIAALRDQNAAVATGQIGQQPVRPGQECQITLSTLGRLTEPEEFGNIILRASRDGRTIRIRDVAHVELGAKNEDVSSHRDGHPAVTMVVYQLPGANALEVADGIHAKLRELAKDFPDDMIYETQYDSTPYTRECIKEVYRTLGVAIVLVACVVLLFLQNWRSAIIPLVAVPVAIVGTFTVMLAFGFSLNILTLFGLVLAIGIVVDDAIVVVEAVEHQIEKGLGPREATIKAMSQVSGPIIAMGLVLSAVFVPCMFISGVTGQFFRQFALTIASSTILSMFNSLSLSPALTALLLRSRDKETHEPLPRLAFGAMAAWAAWEYLAPQVAALVADRFPAAQGMVIGAGGWTLDLETVIALVVAAVAALPGWLVGRWCNGILLVGFRWFERGFAGSVLLYLRMVAVFLRTNVPVLVVYVGLLALTWWWFVHTPRGFIPSQDMGYLLVNIQTSETTAVGRTRATIAKASRIAQTTDGVAHVVAFTGTSLLLSVSGSHFGSLFVILDDFSEREDAKNSSDAIANRLRKRFAKELPEAELKVLPPPPIRGAGRSGGFKIMVEDRSGDLTPEELQEYADTLTRRAAALQTDWGKPRFTDLFSSFRADSPQLFANVDRRQCLSMGVSLQAVFGALQAFLGSYYVNDFNRFGRTWQVIVQAAPQFRDVPEKIRRLKVRNTAGQMVPLGAVADIREINGPLVLTRYNMYVAAMITGNAGAGTSSGEALDVMADLTRSQLPKSMDFEWTEMAFLELQAGSTAMQLFGFAVVMVFLVLAAQYESWSMPVAVILVVPMCLLSAIAGVALTRTDVNIFTQIGFVVLVGLASKNAILIVEYAKRQRDGGEPPVDAALAACKLRLRPIVMTSCAFILGVFPLLIGRGAGAEMRRTLGTAVFSGMLGVTLFGIILTPVFFVVVDRVSRSRLFASRVMDRVSRFSLGVFALGFLWASFRFLGFLLRMWTHGVEAEAEEEEEAEAEGDPDHRDREEM